MPLPDAPDVPSIGQAIIYAFYGIGAAIAVILGGRGFIAGKRSPQPGTHHAEIAGAIIDAKKADEIIKAIDTQTLAIANSATSTKAQAEALDRNTDAVERATNEIGEARQDIRELTREIVRSGKG